MLALLLGFEGPGAALLAIGRQWNVFLFILGLMGLGAAADESGAFEWIAERLVQAAGGSRRRLFSLLFLGGALLTVFFSNDATAIVFTPVVYRAVVKRGGDALPFLFGCVFVADTASFGLPFSNPANILVLPRPHMLDYLWHLGPPAIFAVAINLAIFLRIFRSPLRGRYEYQPAQVPQARAIRTIVAMAGVGIAYFCALGFDWPLGVVAIAGAILTLSVAHVRPRAAAGHISWSTFALIAGLFVVLDAVARAGLISYGAGVLEHAARAGSLGVIVAAASSSALLANVFNNLPVAVAASYVVAHAASQYAAYPLIVGIDLGPNLTTAGSLATILWVAILRQRGVHVSALEYLRLGAIVVPPMIAVSVLWLWLVR